ncbi:MAG: threonine aldolase [Opitutae bacterium]|nr:threonine aldolase [Opitutae bacterium]
MNPVRTAELSGLETIPSPALLVFPSRVEANLALMIQMVNGDVSRLRPHVKTHKMAEVVQLQVAKGITQFKCATIAEAEMTAESGGLDVLLAHQPVGPNLARFLQLQERFPEVAFSALVDSPEMVAAFEEKGRAARLFVDLDCGMHRTGISPGEEAFALCRLIADSSHLEFAGLHAYDGHLHQTDLSERTEAHAAAIESWAESLHGLDADGIAPPAIVVGGSPTFGLFAQMENWQCSPGTTLFWDAGYGHAFADLEFACAAMLLTRVISKPDGRLCLDLGHKAVAAERTIDKRAWFPELPEAKPFLQSEEHFVLDAPNAGEFSVGDALLAIPWHVCPTVALHDHAHLVMDGRVSEDTWEVRARKRSLSV